MIQDIDPVFFSIGPVHVRYYGILYMTGFLCIYIFLRFLIKKSFVPRNWTLKMVEDYIFLLVIWVVIGSRAFEVIFYNSAYFLEHPWEVFAIWEGGLSFHGGALAAFLYTLYSCRKHKIPVVLWVDALVIPVSLGLALGRFANFLNGELYGFPVANQDNPPWWSVLFQRTDPLQLYRYPTQIFESLSYLLLCLILIFIFIYLVKKGPLPLTRGGLLSGVFCIGYAVFRFIVEYWKDYEQNVLWGLSMGQLLNIPMLIFGVIFLIIWMRTRPSL